MNEELINDIEEEFKSAFRDSNHAESFDKEEEVIPIKTVEWLLNSVKTVIKKELEF